MFEESSLRESYEKVVIEVLSPNGELIDLVTHASLESVPTCLSSLALPLCLSTR